MYFAYFPSAKFVSVLVFNYKYLLDFEVSDVFFQIQNLTILLMQVIQKNDRLLLLLMNLNCIPIVIIIIFF